MFDHKPREPLLRIAAEAPPESFETRVLRELAAINERLAKLEAAPPQIVAHHHATFYDPLGASSFTFSGVKDEDGVSVDFTLDPLGVVRVESRKVVASTSYLPEPSPWPYQPPPYQPSLDITGRIVSLPNLFDDDGKPIPGAAQRRSSFYQGLQR
jgi:hypothetical protein